jgi:prepilin-type N-terminal cleavage/methylation domain-containing protein
MKQKRGFTLIELLVVIAIIGILSAVVLASLNSARTKGNDAALKANLGTVATQAALYLTENNSYGTFDDGAGAPDACPTSGTGTVFHNQTIMNAIAQAVINSSGGDSFCLSTGNAYAVAVSRPPEVATSTSAYWCVDSTGVKCGVDDASLVGTNCGACDSSQ